MKTASKVTISIIIAIVTILFGIGVGSTFISPIKVGQILLFKIFQVPLASNITNVEVSIVWNLRLARTLIAFVVGGAIAVSGSAMQSVLKNPLASSYTLGVSSGASLGAGIVMMFSIALIGKFTLPVVGILCGVGTVILSVFFASKLDRNLQNFTIILVGMVFSLFINALITLINALSRENMQRLIYWQMGSFSGKDFVDLAILTVISVAGIFFLFSKSKELDILTFGEKEAFSIGVDVKKTKWSILCVSAGLTGSAISFVGVIGFVDLIAPHVVRKFFGSKHQIVIPMSAIFGGIFMIISDIIARTIISPSELPVGAVTAILGAPFFAYVFFKKKKEDTEIND